MVYICLQKYGNTRLPYCQYEYDTVPFDSNLKVMVN